MPETRTLVVDAAREGSALDRTLRRLLRAEPRSTDVVVVSHRSLGLAPVVARRVRLVRERTPADVSARITALVAEGATAVRVHRPGSSLSLSACLIVKDEEAVIAACLDAVTPFVDEVVVYDTGSTDRTVAVARAAGARVVEGYWDDHFGRARNRAIERCTGDWVLVVDADEVVVGDPAGLRDALGAAEAHADVAVVPIVSTSWSGGEEGTETRAQRLARRGRVRWSGRLHEQLVTVPEGREPVVAAITPPVRLMHSGYHQAVVSEKDKAARNLHLARTELAAAGPEHPERGKAVSNYGRTLFVAGRTDEALAVLEELKPIVGKPRLVLPSGRLCVTALTAASRFEAARVWLGVIAENQESHGNLEVARARLALAEGDVPAARTHLRAAVDPPPGARGVDAWGIAFDQRSAVPVSVEVALAEHDHAGALAILEDQLRDDPEGVDLDQLARAADAGGTSWAEILGGAPERFLDRLVRQVMTMDEAVGLRWCTAFARARPGDHRAIVAGCLLGARGDLATALTWSVTAREAGLPQLCPVRAGAEQEQRPAHERALLWALLTDAFGEFDALARYHETLALVSPVDLRPLQETVASLAPSLAGSTAAAR